MPALEKLSSIASPPVISKDAPLRLADAAILPFPLGGITASGLRKEANRGNLAVERIAGKDYTTLASIETMRKNAAAIQGRETLFEKRRRRRSVDHPRWRQRISTHAALLTVAKLSEPLRVISPPNTNRRKNVIAIRRPSGGAT